MGGTHSAFQYRAIGAHANTVLGRVFRDALGRKVAKSLPERCNAMFDFNKEEVDFVATRHIHKGEEIFADYGTKRHEYMDLILRNSPGLEEQIQERARLACEPAGKCERCEKPMSILE
jgi:hypothetical protein